MEKQIVDKKEEEEETRINLREEWNQQMKISRKRVLKFRANPHIEQWTAAYIKKYETPTQEEADENKKKNDIALKDAEQTYDDVCKHERSLGWKSTPNKELWMKVYNNYNYPNYPLIDVVYSPKLAKRHYEAWVSQKHWTHYPIVEAMYNAKDRLTWCELLEDGKRIIRRMKITE